MKNTFSLLTGLLLLAAGTLTTHAVTFQFVTVGNAGNAADPLNSGSVPGIGSVADPFRIATTEVTIGQYTEFLNAVADTDANGLYDPRMGTNGNIFTRLKPGKCQSSVIHPSQGLRKCRSTRDVLPSVSS